jgi:hypothetical protein
VQRVLPAASDRQWVLAVPFPLRLRIARDPGELSRVLYLFHPFTHDVKVAFFRGTSLRPAPPGASKGKDRRHIDFISSAKTRQRSFHGLSR